MRRLFFFVSRTEIKNTLRHFNVVSTGPEQIFSVKIERPKNFKMFEAVLKPVAKYSTRFFQKFYGHN